MSNLSDPASNFAAVTPSDSVDFTAQCRGLYVGGAGDLVAVGADEVAVTFVGVAAGTVLPLRAIRVNATSTTATSIVQIY